MTNTSTQNFTTDLSLERQRQVAEANAWSPAFAKGFLEGESARRKGEMAALYHRVGTDQYALGFRTGFFERAAAPAPELPKRKAA